MLQYNKLLFHVTVCVCVTINLNLHFYPVTSAFSMVYVHNCALCRLSLIIIVLETCYLQNILYMQLCFYSGSIMPA